MQMQMQIQMQVCGGGTYDSGVSPERGQEHDVTRLLDCFDGPPTFGQVRVGVAEPLKDRLRCVLRLNWRI